MALIVGLVIVTVIIVQDYVGPRKNVVVEFYDIDVSVQVGSTKLSLERATYQPEIDVRLSSFLRRRSKPLVIVDGTMSNNGPVPIVAFSGIEGSPSGVIVSRSSGESFVAPVNTTGADLCLAETSRIPSVEPGKSRRFNVSFAVDRGSDFSWMKEELRNGHLPSFSFGPFAEGDCSVIKEDLSLGDVRRAEFERYELPEVELRDYYPFGAPTANEFSLNERRYWSDWLPRVD